MFDLRLDDFFDRQISLANIDLDVAAWEHDDALAEAVSRRLTPLAADANLVEWQRRRLQEVLGSARRTIEAIRHFRREAAERARRAAAIADAQFVEPPDDPDELN